MRTAPHSVSLRQLQYAVAVADTRSFRRAADRCHVSQPSLSSQIAQAERSLGVQLFERDRRHVLLTPAGEELVARARRLLLDADDFEDAAARFVDPLSGTLRIGVIPTISPYLLPEVAPALRRELPRLQIVWTEDRTAGVVAALHAGSLDAGLVALEAELGDVEHAEVARDSFVVAAAPTHTLGRSDKPLNASALEEEDLLLLADGHCLRDQALAACHRDRIPGSAFSATSLGTLVQMVASGAGVTLLPELALPIENRRGELRIRRFTRPSPARTIALIWRRGAPLGGGLKRIAEIMRAAYPKRESAARA